MTGDVFDIKRFALHDGPGIRTTVFLRGCPLECWWCHNPEARADCGVRTWRMERSVRALPDDDNVIGPRVRQEALVEEIMRDEVFYRVSSGGVTLSGGEPLVQHEFASALLAACRRKGLHTALDTSGYASWDVLEEMLGSVCLFLYDLKLADGEAHERYTGKPNDLIMENFVRLAASGAELNVRIPLIPGITDTERNIDGLARFIEETGTRPPLSLLPYNRFGEDKFERYGLEYRSGALKTQSRARIESLRGMLEKRSFEVRIGG